MFFVKKKMKKNPFKTSKSVQKFLSIPTKALVIKETGFLWKTQLCMFS